MCLEAPEINIMTNERLKELVTTFLFYKNYNTRRFFLPTTRLFSSIQSTRLYHCIDFLVYGVNTGYSIDNETLSRGHVTSSSSQHYTTCTSGSTKRK